jgi:hypothetical protein
MLPSSSPCKYSAVFLNVSLHSWTTSAGTSSSSFATEDKQTKMLLSIQMSISYFMHYNVFWKSGGI